MASTYALEEPTEVPAEHLEFARSLIAGCRFRAATQGRLGPEPVTASPHSYVRRDHIDPVLVPAFDRFLGMIRQHGFKGRFLATTYVYLCVGEHRYWESPSAFPPIVPILNRADNARAPMLLPGAKLPTQTKTLKGRALPKETPASTALSPQLSIWAPWRPADD
jgi:hypothetical protein